MSSETSSVDKSEAVAVVVSNSEHATPSVKATMSSQKKTKKSKTKVKAAVAVVAATQEISEAEHLSNLTVDHPYLSVLYKRIRSHRKKLEKIKGLETAQQQEGKKLNAQQIELMGNKASLEKLVVELEMLREQFVGVYAEEMKQKKQQEPEEETGAVEEVAVEKEEREEVVEQEEEATEPQVETESTQEKIEEKTEDFANVFELLKTLHLVNLHQALGKEVPMVLDFFSKVLLGNTRPPAELSYEENLMESLEEAKRYLTDNDKVFACDTTYSGLRAFVDQLASISSGKNEDQEVAEAEAAEQVEGQPVEVEDEASSVPVVPAEINTMPQISFFTDSQLESENGDEAAEGEKVEVTESQVEVAEAQESEVDVLVNNGVQIEEQVEVPVEAPPAPESVPAPPLSFAAVAAGATTNTERTPSPSASSGSSGNDKKEPKSPRKNSRRRGQGRWREKGSNSSGNKSGNGSPTDGGKPRRPRAPRTNDENNGVQGGKHSGSKEGRRPHVDRGLRKQGSSTQQHATPMIAPHA